MVKNFKQCFDTIDTKEENFKKTYIEEDILMQNFAHEDIVNFLQNSPTFHELVQFHTSYKYFIYAKSHKAYKTLGNIVANHDKKSLNIVLKEYEDAFLKAIVLKSSISNTYNVLLHIFGYFKKIATDEQKNEMLSLMQEFKNEKISLSLVVKKINFYVKKYNIDYLKKQKILKQFSIQE